MFYYIYSILQYLTVFDRFLMSHPEQRLRYALQVRLLSLSVFVKSVNYPALSSRPIAFQYVNRSPMH
jgi:hypothetical protein